MDKLIKGIVLLVLSILITIYLNGLSTNKGKVYTVKEYDTKNSTLILTDKNEGNKIIYEYPIVLQEGVKVAITDEYNILNNHRNRFMKNIDISYEYFGEESEDIIKPTYDDLLKLQGKEILVEQDLDNDNNYDILDYSILKEVDYNNIYLEDGSEYNIESVDITIAKGKESTISSIIRNAVLVIIVGAILILLGILIKVISRVGRV